MPPKSVVNRHDARPETHYRNGFTDRRSSDSAKLPKTKVDTRASGESSTSVSNTRQIGDPGIS
ncbi:Protein Wnt-2 [Anopheles sinensis]|uniref:Protein Wnt-2 n=1 Tax=Anopheles sinensis TaxID=74873 RepID=A0A084WLG6_ANOSI|nr:Protein Wnt-2 [Anopheles sinensis]